MPLIFEYSFVQGIRTPQGPGGWRGLRSGPIKAGSGSQGPAPARSRAAGGTSAAPVPGMGHLSGDGLRLGCGPGSGIPWLGKAGLWGAGDWPGWGAAGTGAGGPRGLQWCPAKGGGP